MIEKWNSPNIAKYDFFFEDLDARNTIFPLRFMGFFLFQTSLHVDDVIILSYLHACTYISVFPCANSQIYWAETWPTTCRAASLGDGGMMYRLK